MGQETFNITSKQHISVNTLVNDKTSSHKRITKVKMASVEAVLNICSRYFDQNFM